MSEEEDELLLEVGRDTNGNGIQFLLLKDFEKIGI